MLPRIPNVSVPAPPPPGESLRAIKAFVDPSLIALSLLTLVWLVNGHVAAPDAVLALISFLMAYPGNPHFRQDKWAMLASILQRWTIMVGILAALGYASGYLQSFDSRPLLAWLVLAPIVVWGAHLALPRLLPRVLTLHGMHRAIIVGANELGQHLGQTINDNRFETRRVVAFFDDRDAKRVGYTGALPVAGGLDDVASYVIANKVNVIYVALPLISNARTMRLIESLRDTTASVYFVPDIYFLDLIQARVDSVGPITVLAVCESPFSGQNAYVKRAFDIVAALVLLTLCAPLMALTAAAVALSSNGPVLFKQRRYGLDGQEISVWKFRSMTVAEDGKCTYNQVRVGDPRVTRIGRIIRRTSIDELPQLFNVLGGSMSLIGPRPHAIAVNESYRRLIPGYMLRHKVKPGISGWAQVNGYRGGDDLESMRKRVHYDLEYLKNWSLSLDMQILLRSIYVALRGDPIAF